MTSASVNLDRPPYAEVETRVRHLLRDLYGFVPLDIGSEIARRIHDSIELYQDDLLEYVKGMEEA